MENYDEPSENIHCNNINNENILNDICFNFSTEKLDQKIDTNKNVYDIINSKSETFQEDTN